MEFADNIKLLRVTLDLTLSFDKHVIDDTRSCHYHIRALRHIRPLLTVVAVAIVGSRPVASYGAGWARPQNLSVPLHV